MRNLPTHHLNHYLAGIRHELRNLNPQDWALWRRFDSYPNVHVLSFMDGRRDLLWSVGGGFCRVLPWKSLSKNPILVDNFSQALRILQSPEGVSKGK